MNCIINEVRQIIEQIQATSGKLAKEKILRDNADNAAFKNVIHFLLNSFILTGLSTKKIRKQVNMTPTVSFQNAFEAMEYLKENNTGSDEIIFNIQAFINEQPENMWKFYEQLFTKSLRLGCAANTVNKVYGKGFVPQMEIQQAVSIEKYKMKDNEWFSLSEKLNGVRGAFVDGKFYSRQGHEYEGLDHIIADIETMGISHLFLDGELKRKNTDGVSDNENFRLTASILAADDSDKSQIGFTIFDVMTKEEFIAGESDFTHQVRLVVLDTIRESIPEYGIENIDVVEVLYSGTDQSKIGVYLDLMTAQDKEGLMLNRDVTYKCKRHNGILKVKTFYNIDLEVIDVEEGSGRLQGTLGALVVDFKGNSVNVGSGFSDNTRKQIWDNKDDIIGRIIEVKYKEISKDKTGKESLQFPVFVAVREDKDSVSFD